MIRYARFQGIHAMAQRELLPRAVLGFFCTTTPRALDQRRAVKLGPQGVTILSLFRGTKPAVERSTRVLHGKDS